MSDDKVKNLSPNQRNFIRGLSMEGLETHYARMCSTPGAVKKYEAIMKAARSDTRFDWSNDYSSASEECAAAKQEIANRKATLARRH